MSQEPWNEEIYQSRGSRQRRIDAKTASKSGIQFFTILVVIFAFITIVITALAIYLSNGGSQTKSSDEFYNASSSSVVETSASQVTEVSESESSEESSVAYSEENTIVVLEGEGSVETAARAGITAEELERLNPDKMVGPGGSWLVYPGDVVRIE